MSNTQINENQSPCFIETLLMASMQMVHFNTRIEFLRVAENQTPRMALYETGLFKYIEIFFTKK